MYNTLKQTIYLSLLYSNIKHHTGLVMVGVLDFSVVHDGIEPRSD
jgi:hypothetical protein